MMSTQYSVPFRGSHTGPSPSTARPGQNTVLISLFTFVWCTRSYDSTNTPRHDLLGAEAERLGLARRSRCHVDQNLEQPDPVSDLVLPGERGAGIEVHVTAHPLEQPRGGADLEARCWARSEHRA